MKRKLGQTWIKCGGVLLALGLIACETERVQTGRGGRRGGSGTTGTSTTSGNGSNSGSNNNQTPGTSGNMQDILEYCAKKSACLNQRDLNLSRCANQGTYIVAYAREHGDPAQVLDCIARVKSASCGELPDCGWPQPESQDSEGTVAGDPDDLFEEEGGFASDGRCEGTVAVHGDPENEVRHDCANQPSRYDRAGTNQNCIVNDRGQARCGISSCEEVACYGAVTTRCKNGVLQGLYDCANRTRSRQCFLNSEGRPACGYDTCASEDTSGEDDSDANYICSGSVRASCYRGIAYYLEDCAYEGFACLTGSGEENSNVAGCGREFTGCTRSECRGDKVVTCDRGAEAVIDCRTMDSSYSTCQLFQDNLRDSALTPMCSVPSSQRDCSGISATCEGNVAKVCVGGKLQSVDCSSVLPGGVCVLQTGNSEIDVRCRSTD
ncbi:MAG: hypothetical protein VYC39_08695 [Myxococcota bacterium]|nr:hypothetical protein [Myxococcota bacterium]